MRKTASATSSAPRSHDALSTLAKKTQKHERLSLRERIRTFFIANAKPVLSFIMENKFYQGFMLLLTIHALFGDDIRLMTTSTSTDQYFDVIVLVVLALFTIEVVLGCFVREDYIFGFFFYLDIIATVSLIFDHTSVAYAIAGEGTDSGSGAGDLRAGRAGRVGSRAGRIIRVIRVVRLVRVVKLYKAWLDVQRRHQHGGGEDTPSPMGEEDDESEVLHQESRVGKRLSELTTQRVIILVISMLVGGGLLAFDETAVLGQSSQIGIDSIYQTWARYRLAVDSRDPMVTAYREAYERALLFYVYFHSPHDDPFASDLANTSSTKWLSKLAWIGILDSVADVTLGISDGYVKDLPVSTWDSLFDVSTDVVAYNYLPPTIKSRLSAPFNNLCQITTTTRAIGIGIWNDTDCPMVLLRFTEQSVVKVQIANPFFVAVFDLRDKIANEAKYNLFQTIFVCIIVASGAMIFSSDANTMVLNPIERMISKVKKIREDPLYALKMGDEQYRLRAQVTTTTDAHKEPGKAGDEVEVEVEEVTCFMRCKEWVAKHISRKNSVEEDDLKQKSMETKILENTIIKLGTLLALGFGEAGSEIIGQNMSDDAATVNAMIPGKKVDGIYGFCDIRNFTDTTEVLQDKVMVFVNQVAMIVHGIVDSFLGAPNKNVGDAFLLVWRLTGLDKKQMRKMADMSVMAFVKVVIQINRSALLAVYREHPALLARLPNYRVRLGFGLHLGWAIEGAIGSEYKIDASYLSPHVNMSARLEAATKQYACTILMSEPLVRSCTPLMAKQFRCIDHVALKGTKAPTRIFTIDLHERVLTVDQNPQRKIKNRYKARLLRDEMKNAKMLDSYSVVKEFSVDEDLRRMRSPYFLSFFQEFEKGYLNYEAGEWDVARTVLEKTRGMVGECPEDGPSVTLLMFMKERDYDAKGWQGYRELSEK